MTMIAMTSRVNADVKLELEGCRVPNVPKLIGDLETEDARVSAAK